MDSKKVEILGRYYTIRGIDDQEYLEKLSKYVDEHMRKIATATGTVDTLKVAILAALTMADEHFRAEQERQDHDAELEKNIDALSDQIQMVMSS